MHNREKCPKDKCSGAIQTINVTMLNRRSDHDFYRHALAVGADRLYRAAVGFGDCQSDREADTGTAWHSAWQMAVFDPQKRLQMCLFVTTGTSKS